MEDLLKKISESTAKNLIYAYGLGFFVWNLHLNSFGYFEQNILQTRFLSAGLLALTFSIIPARLLLNFLERSVKNYYISLLSIGVGSIGLLFFFTFVIFPKIPQYMGGAKPFTKWLIADPEEIEFLSNFNILSERNGNKPPVETSPICEIYTNQDIVIIGTRGVDGQTMRVISVKKEDLRGFQSVPPVIPNKDAFIFCEGFYL